MQSAGNWPSTKVTLLDRLADPSDPASWDEFWEIYSPLVYRFCLKRSLQHEDALDVRQNAMVSVRRSIGNYDPAKGKFRGWLGQLIRHEIAKYVASTTRQGRAVGGGFEVGQELQVEDPEWDSEFNGHVVQVALDNIKADFDAIEWIVMKEVVLAGRRPRDVTEEIGRDAAWISRAKYRLMQRLKAEVHRMAEGGLE